MVVMSVKGIKINTLFLKDVSRSAYIYNTRCARVIARTRFPPKDPKKKSDPVDLNFSSHWPSP